MFVANEHGGTVTAIRGDRIVKVFTDSVQPAGLASVGNLMGLLDVRKNDLTVYDAEAMSIVGSTPAGDGPTHLVADKHGRYVAADTRGDAVRVFDTKPSQIAEIAQPGGPYGIAYDPVRDRLWVASSGTNEVIGYDMAGPVPARVRAHPDGAEPLHARRRRHQRPTVRRGRDRRCGADHPTAMTRRWERFATHRRPN